MTDFAFAQGINSATMDSKDETTLPLIYAEAPEKLSKNITITTTEGRFPLIYIGETSRNLKKDERTP